MSNDLKTLAAQMRKLVYATDENSSPLPRLVSPQVATPPSANQEQEERDGKSEIQEQTEQQELASGPINPPNTMASVGSNTATGSGSDATAAVFPEVAPIIFASKLPQNVSIPRKVWEGIYGILRSHGDEWTDIRELHAQYLVAMGSPLSNDYLRRQCGVRSIKELLEHIPWVKNKFSVDGNMYVKLSPTRVRQSQRTIGSVDQRPHRFPRGATARAIYDDDDEWTWNRHLIPPQPKHVLPPGAQIPQDLRQQVYDLLVNWYPKGIDISTFAEAYNKHYKTPINTIYSCRMSLACTLHLMADIVDTGVYRGRQWLRPIPYDTIKQLFTEEELRQHAMKREEQYEEPPARKQEEENSDPLQIAKDIRAEIKEMLASYDDGINIECLSIVYGMTYPDRAITRESHEILKAWLKEMPDLVVVFSKEEFGVVADWVMLKK